MSFSPATGAYVLVIRVQTAVTISVGKLGNVTFIEGWYTYIGSAMGHTSTTLQTRLQRHFAPSDRKKLHWHVDYLLASPHVRLEGALAVPSTERLECKIIPLLREKGGQTWGIKFGASDCPTCPSHLLSFQYLGKTLPSNFILCMLQKCIQQRYNAVHIVLPPGP